MRTRPLGASGIEASAVGLGTWAIGGWMWGGTDESASIRSIHAALDNGINLIDTAPVYGFGISEEIVGQAIQDRRDSVVLATKCGLVWNNTAGDFHFSSDKHGCVSKGEGEIQVYKYLAPASIREEVENSLRRLRTDYIDLYQTHWQESTTPRSETMAMLLTLKQEGKIRAIGVSNATPEQMDEYRAVGVIDTDQESFSMIDRDPLNADGNLPYCETNNIAFLAYSPIARGLLSGKMTADRNFGKGDHRETHPRFSLANRVHVQAMLDEMKPVADDLGLSLAQLAIAWAIHQPGGTHALVGARNQEQVESNAKAAAAELSEVTLAQIRLILETHAEAIV